RWRAARVSGVSPDFAKVTTKSRDSNVSATLTEPLGRTAGGDGSTRSAGRGAGAGLVVEHAVMSISATTRTDSRVADMPIGLLYNLRAGSGSSGRTAPRRARPPAAQAASEISPQIRAGLGRSLSRSPSSWQHRCQARICSKTLRSGSDLSGDRPFRASKTAQAGGHLGQSSAAHVTIRVRRRSDSQPNVPSVEQA